jgi:hypothetical protein
VIIELGMALIVDEQLYIEGMQSLSRK